MIEDKVSKLAWFFTILTCWSSFVISAWISMIDYRYIVFTIGWLLFSISTMIAKGK